MTQNFKEGRRAQIVNALRDAAEQQATPVQPKSEAQIESERSAAAVALNAVFLRELKARFGKVERTVTAVDVTTEALKDAMVNARARQTA
ncbi:MAG TPA: hypothetical protein VN956_16675 [Pyrinomonadaceae bacterium]|jgi:hypothetical protein|nr:hypothetical protein [Pyrinomonadaceae bacterium]